MSEPVSCCMHGIDLCDIKTDDKVVIIGCGMIGLIMLQLAKRAGAATIIAIEPDKEKRSIAKELGARIVINPIEENVQKVLAENGVNRVTKVIECVGKTKTMEQAISIAGKNQLLCFSDLPHPMIQ